MDTASSLGIVGSWLFIRSTHPEFLARHIYHFTADGKCYFEVDSTSERILSAPLLYRIVGERLTLTYSGGNEHDFELHPEVDGTTRWSEAKGDYWMTRLSKPEPYSLAFLDENGLIQKLPQPGVLPGE